MSVCLRLNKHPQYYDTKMRSYKIKKKKEKLTMWALEGEEEWTEVRNESHEKLRMFESESSSVVLVCEIGCWINFWANWFEEMLDVIVDEEW